MKKSELKVGMKVRFNTALAEKSFDYFIFRNYVGFVVSVGNKTTIRTVTGIEISAHNKYLMPCEY